jgi:hypothetical protein
VTPYFGASLTDESNSIIYDCNMFMIQATDGSIGPGYVLQILPSKNHKIRNISTATEARQKISTDL